MKFIFSLAIFCGTLMNGCGLSPVNAQNLPSVKTLSAELVAPATANAGYGSLTTHTNSTGLMTNPLLIQELAKSLGATTLEASDYKKKVFEYVYENIETEFQFGLSKGGYGALLDQSGTPFDIANLTAELLREAGISASYKIGTISLNAKEFGEWTGLVHDLNETTQSFKVSAAAACKFLAAGGIPATINGAGVNPTCAFGLNELLTSVSLTHIWVVSDADYLDPAFKRRILTKAADLRAILGCPGSVSSCGDQAKAAVLSGAQTGYDPAAGANYLQAVNKAGLKTHLSAKAQNLTNYINSINGHITTEQLVGGQVVEEMNLSEVNLGVLPYAVGSTYLTVIGDIPNQYRTTLRIKIDTIDKTLFLDEINGYWLSVDGGKEKSSASNTYLTYVELVLEGRYDATGFDRLILATSSRPDGNAGNDDLAITINHPYRAAAGAYADEVYAHDSYVRYLSNDNTFLGAVHINASVGHTGEGRLQQDRDWASSTPSPLYGFLACNDKSAANNDNDSVCMYVRVDVPALASAWRLQTSQMIKIGDGLNGASTQHLHSIGMIASIDSRYDMTAVSSYGVTSVIDDANDRRASMFANATVSAEAEGGVFQQVLDSWIDTSAIGLFNHANDDNVRFYKANSSNVSSVLGVSTDYSSGEIANINDYFLNASPAYEGIILKRGKTQTFSTNSASTYFDIAPFLAFDGSYEQIAFVTTAKNKAGGGTAPADPLDAALGFLEELSPKGYEPFHSIDDSTGAINLAPPPDISVGNGDFPYSLAFQRRFNSERLTNHIIVDPDEGSGDFTLPGSKVARSVVGLPPGWTHDFHVRARFANDAMIAMRPSGDATYAASVIASLQALSDLARDGLTFERSVAGVFVVQVLKESFQANVLNVDIPDGAVALFKKLDGSYIPVGARTASVSFAGGVRAPFVTPGGGSDHRYETFNFTVKLKDGSQLDFSSAGYDITYYTGVQQNAGVNEFKLDKWRFPTGMEVNYTYSDNSKFPITRRYNLTRVSNSLGYQLLFTYSSEAFSGYVLTVSDGASRTASVVKQDPFEFYDQTYCFSRSDAKASCYTYRGPTIVGLFSFNPDGTAWSGTDNESLKMANFGSRQRLVKVYLPGDVNQSNYAITAINPTLEISYNEASQVRSVWDQLRRRSDFYLGKVAGERRFRAKQISPISAQSEIEFDIRNFALLEINPTGDETRHAYDAIGRRIRTTFPEGIITKYTYDSFHNVISEQVVPKPNSSDPILTTSYQFANAAWPRKATAITDPRGATTNFTYASATGLLTEILEPAGTSGVRPKRTFAYTSFGRLDSITDPVLSVSKIEYHSINGAVMAAHQNGELKKVTRDFGGLNIATQLTYDAVGNVLSVDYPRADVTDVTSISYDGARRVQQRNDPESAQTNYFYTIEGALERVEAATGDASAPWAVTTYQYDAVGRIKKATDPDEKATQTFYDAAGRPIVVIDAENRATRTVYDAAGRVLKVIRAWAGNTLGTGATLDCAVMRAATAADPTKLQQCYQEYSYTADGQIASVTDADGNKTTYEYDGFDRLEKTIFPSKTLIGQPSTADPDPFKHDYEEYAYDANGNMVSKRARDRRVITMEYDALNRLTQRTVPGSSDADGNYNNFDFAYDLAGRQLSNSHWNYTIRNTYDAAGRLKQKTHNNAMAIAYDYDPAGNVTKLTYPGGTYFVSHIYDALNRVTRTCEGVEPAACATAPTTGATALLARVGYDPLSRRTSIALRNGTSAGYGYTKRGDLTCHDWNFTGPSPASCNSGTPEAAYDFAYNGVGQLISEAVSDPLLRRSPPADQTDVYAKNGLNQYASIATTPAGGVTTSVAPAYDGNGNIAKDHRGRAYVYSAENALYTAREAGTNALLAQNIYYADGTRRYLNSAASGIRRFYYDGDQEIEETGDLATDVRRRYVRLPGSVDEPFLMIEYDSAGAETNRLYAHQNRLGSVVAVTNSSGAVVEKYRYGPYGELTGEPASGFPFRFTGQKLDAETGLYYYKARFYDAETGRFLQTDPIGYEADQNLYVYVGNDPVNVTDPTGECPWCIGALIGAAIETGVQLAENGGDISKVDVGKVAVAAALGAVGGGAAGAAVKAVGRAVTRQAVKASARAGARPASSGAQRGAQTSRSLGGDRNVVSRRPPNDPIGDEKRAGEAKALKGLGAGAVTGAATGGYTGYKNDGVEGAVAGAIYGGLQGSVAGFVGGAVAGAGGGAVAGFVASGILNAGNRNIIDQATQLAAQRRLEDQ